MLKRGWWLCLMVLAAGCAGVNPPEPDPAARASLVHTPSPISNLTRTAAAQPTRNDYFRVQLLFPESGCLVMGDNPALVRVMDRWGDTVGGAVVKLQLWLPSQALDGPACQVRESEAGIYHVTGLSISQPGEWMLTLTINRSGREDWAIWELTVAEPDKTRATARPNSPTPSTAKANPSTPLAPTKPTLAKAVPVKAAPVKAASPEPPSAQLNLATSRASDKRLYKVAYLSKPEPAKPNQPVTWRVTLLTKDGRPVSGAKLSLSLSRPPEGPQRGMARLVAKDQGKGHYLVEGLRFPGKGWWQVGLDISGKKGKDRVDFNLVLK